ncbi:MAG: hypothetical protein IJ468_10790 [Lachnospiraceae bacterium]|nr:hypothetical protein [Lachnospiraceae bacterium]
MTEQKITFRCQKCKHRLFDWIEGDFTLVVKCVKCKRVLRAHGVKHREVKEGNTPEEIYL